MSLRPCVSSSLTFRASEVFSFMLADQRRLPPVSARIPERVSEFPELDRVYSWATLRSASALLIWTTLPPLHRDT